MHSFCSDISRNNKEEFTGTASPFRFCLLIECNEAWSGNALSDSSIPDDVKKHILRLYDLDQDARIQLIRKNEKSPHIQVFWSDGNPQNPQLFGIQIKHYAELLKYDFIDFIEHTPAHTWQKIVDSQFFICTNGRHDPCCAKYGIALFQSVTTQFSQVWQTTHLGGDRFAATVLALPESIYYRRVDEHALIAIINAHQRQELYLPHFAGRTTLSREAQVGEYFIRQQTQNSKLQSLFFIDTTQDSDTSTMHFQDTQETHHYVTIKKENSPIRAKFTCSAQKSDLLSRYILIKYWQ